MHDLLNPFQSETKIPCRPNMDKWTAVIKKGGHHVAKPLMWCKRIPWYQFDYWLNNSVYLIYGLTLLNVYQNYSHRWNTQNLIHAMFKCSKAYLKKLYLISELRGEFMCLIILLLNDHLMSTYENITTFLQIIIA